MGQKVKRMYNARFNKKGNIKTGSMWTWSKLKGNQPIQSKYGDVLGSCGVYCEGCSGSCYVNASYRYPSVKDGHARNTIAFRNDITGSFNELRSQLKNAKNKPQIVRINQSGEIETALELALWVETASLYPAVKFYLYTKNFDAVRMVIKQHDDGETMPDNITVLISVWHEYGVDAYNEFKHHDFIKAFVYDDGFDYDAVGLDIGSYCMAYDRNGKMDHNITCNKCQKCFNRFHKVIGCYDH